MIPIERVAGGTLANVLYYISILGVLLVVMTLVRLKVSLLRRAFIPASLLAGIVGLLLGPYCLKIIPQEMMSTIGNLPGQMITIVFSCMLLGVSRQDSSKTKTLMHDTLSGLGWLWSNSFMQVGIVSLLCAFLFTPVWKVNPLFGAVFEIGFAGGHGTAGGMASVFTENFKWQDGGDLGMTTATIGLLMGIFGGMILINYGVRKKYTKIITEPATGSKVEEFFAEGNRKASSQATISSDVVEPFAFHFGVIGLAILIGRFIVWGFGVVFGYKGLPLFPFAMIGGWLINAIAQRTFLKHLFDRATFQRIQGIALELLIIGAMASIRIPIVLAYWQPLLVGTVAIMCFMLLWFFWLSPHIFKECWFEQGIIRYGAFTGVAAIGYMLLRTTDPRMETDAGTIYALNGPFMSPFIGGGLVTSLWPYLIQRFGALGFGLIACGISIAILIALRLFFWKSNPVREQR